MEILFHKSVCTYLKTLTAQTKSQELTQEIRIPDSMPDVGRVLGCWGQIVIRGKEWSNNRANISGGIMVAYLYSPEDGTEPRSADTWIPFQESWEFDDALRDGALYVSAMLKSLDIRCISARKLIVRSTVRIYGEAMVQGEASLYLPENQIENVELLQNAYPTEIPVEIGEKQFQLNEVLPLPSGNPSIKKIICSKTKLEISESRVMTNKLVFRGNANLSLLYLDDGGTLHKCQLRQAFSQLADLDDEYENDATAQIYPVLTGLDVECTDDGQVQFKSSIAAQFVVYERKWITIVEDAYSNNRKVEVHTEEIKIPARLDVYREQIEIRGQLHEPCSEIHDVDSECCIDEVYNEADLQNLSVCCQFQLVCQDENDMVSGAQVKCSERVAIGSDIDNQIRPVIYSVGDTITERTTNGMNVIQTVVLEAEILKEQVFNVITGLVVEEKEQQNTECPSIILKRVENQRIWDIAKECKSTVSKIKEANNMDADELLKDQILLIPVR